MTEIRQVTTGRGRHYVVDTADGEKKLFSVTTILGALPKSLEYWGFRLGVNAAVELANGGELPTQDADELYELAKKTDHAPYRALKKAGNRGSSVHNVAEGLLKTGKLGTLDEGVSDGYVDALVKWYDDHGVADWRIIGVETRLFSVEHLYAGTADLLAQKPDDAYVTLDFKSSKAIYESHTIQAAAYTGAAFEMGLFPPGAKVEEHVVRLGEDGEYEVVIGRHTLDDFLAVKAVHDMLKDKSKTGVKVGQ